MLSHDIDDLQNSALGACAIAKFCIGYATGAMKEVHPPLPLAFVVLPIIFNPVARKSLQSTQEASGLLSFAAKFARPPKALRRIFVDGVEIRHGNENWLALNDRVLEFRLVTMRSIEMGIATGLLQLSIDHASLYAEDSLPMPQVASIETREMLRNAKKLGVLCSRNSLGEISKTLGVAL